MCHCSMPSSSIPPLQDRGRAVMENMGWVYGVCNSSIMQHHPEVCSSWGSRRLVLLFPRVSFKPTPFAGAAVQTRWWGGGMLAPHSLPSTFWFAGVDFGQAGGARRPAQEHSFPWAPPSAEPQLQPPRIWQLRLQPSQGCSFRRPGGDRRWCPGNGLLLGSGWLFPDVSEPCGDWHTAGAP